MRVDAAHVLDFRTFDRDEVKSLLATVRRHQSDNNNVDAVLANWDSDRKLYLEQYATAPKAVKDRDVSEERFEFCACVIVLAVSFATSVEVIRLAASIDRREKHKGD